MSYVGPGCSAIGCRKRKRGNKCPNYIRSDSEGSSDEESETKRTLPRTFHVFPSNPVKKKRWVDSMGRENFTPGSGTLICSDHFKEIDMDRTGQTVRVRQDAIPTRFKKNPKHREKKVKGKVRKKEPDVAVSRCKRNIKVKKRDDEIIEWGPKCRRVLVKKVTKQPMNRSEKKKNTTQKEKKKRTIKVQLTKGSDCVKRMRKDRIKIENNTGYHSLANSSDDLQMDTVNIKEEPISDECIELSEEEIDDTPSAQDFSPVKKTKVSVKARRGPISNGVSKKLVSTSVQIENKFNKMVPVKAKVVKSTVSLGKTASPAKDKIVQLPNNRMYFEFAEPKKKVILHIKPTTETHELKSETLEELLISLKLRCLINSDAEKLLEAFRKLPKGLMRVDVTEVEKLPKTDTEEVKKLPKTHTEEVEKLPKTHTEEVKKFATVIYLHSPKAYDLVKTLFLLPDKTELQERLQNKGCWPGFTQEALDMFKSSDPKSPAELCTIMLDFVSLKKQCDFDASSSKWIGHVDFCGGPDSGDSDGIPVASEILLFTAVGLVRDWKLPFGYFLTEDLSGEALQNLVIEAITVLEECGLKVRALVCEGNRNTIRMGVLFGCNIHPKTFKELVTGFPHPLDKQRKIHLIFGIQHSLNLLINLLSERGILRSIIYGIIDWKFYAQLLDNGRQTQQENIDLLEPDHVEFCHLRKIVRRCRPSFNNMVTRLFELAEDMKLKEFTDSEATANFMADVYRAFDIVNSRNPVTTGEKPPITSLFMGEQLETTTVISRRIYGLEVHPGSRVIDEGRWMSVMLFPFILKSVSIMASNLLNGDCLKYFTTYRLNLDHSDMILSNIQRCGGWDGSPTASEFRQGYKEFFESVTKSKMSVYCNDFDGDDLTIGQGVICPFRRNLPIPAHDDIDFLSRSYCLVDLSMDVAVKATCVIRQISHRLSCTECMALMVDGDYVMDSQKIINLDYIMPSKFITKLLQISERILKMKLLESSQVNFEHTVISIFTECFISLGNLNVFLSVPSDHVKEEPQHVIGLIKAVIRTIISYRLNSTKYLSVVKSKLLKDFR